MQENLAGNLSNGVVRSHAKVDVTVQGPANCAHGNSLARNEDAKKLSRARNYVHVNRSKHLQVVLRCYLK